MNTLVKAEIWTIARTDQGNAVLVRPIGAEIAVPIFIGQLETQSILIGFGDVAVPRPLTHDLMLSVVRRMGSELLRIEINDLKDGTFYARLVLAGPESAGGGEFVLDARPSDALALTVRTKCPVYIAEQVVDAAGVSVNLIMESAAEGLDAGEEGTFENFPRTSDGAEERALRRRALQAELEKAVAAEEYETAAKIRDQLAALGE